MQLAGYPFANTINSISDEQSLRAKVEEALAVYEDYLKNQNGSSNANGPSIMSDNDNNGAPGQNEEKA